MTTWSTRGIPLLGNDFPMPLALPFTMQQAQMAGVTRQQLRGLVSTGLVRRMVKGVYVAAQTPDSLLLRGRALRLAVPEHIVVTDWTACWFHTGYDRPGSHREEPEVTLFRQAGHDRLRNGLCRSGQRTFRPEDVWEVDGLQVTSPLRTAWDLGRLAHRDRAIGALDALLRTGTFSHDELLLDIDRFKGMRGVVQLRELAPLADARAESPTESTLRLRWLDLSSLPRPTPQISITVGDIEVYRVDLGVEDLRYGCEYDGAEFHEDREWDAARRQDLLQRFTWDVDGVRRDNVWGPRRDVEQILIIGIDRARKRLGRPTYLL